MTSFSCKKNSCFKNFEFHFPATITQGDTFDIGDTLWMEMDLPNVMIDHQTGEWIDLSEFDLYFSFSIEKRDTFYVNNYIDNFELIESFGSFYQEGTGLFKATYATFKSKINKKFNLGIIPNKRGVYLLSLNLPIEYGIAEESQKPEDWLQVTPSVCRQGIIEHSKTTFENGCPNYYLIRQYPCQQSSPTDNLIGCSDDSTSLANKGGYAFVVR